MKTISKTAKLKNGLAAITALFLSASINVHAALPDIAGPENAAADGNYIQLGKGYAYDILIVVSLIIGMVSFLVVSKNMIGIYAEIGKGKAEWGDMGAHGAAGVTLLILVVFLLTEASTIIFV